MEKFHNVQSTHVDDAHLYLTVDGHAYRLRWVDCSPKLMRATRSERQHIEVSPSGYGLHWPQLDEDLAITPLLQNAESLEAQEVG